ncbi:MAG: hypothetical protein ACYC3W_08865 [Candidatus Nanopelagicales bacterium]
MSVSRISRIVGSAVIVAALGAGLMASTASATPQATKKQATKKIVCYKGTAAKKFSAKKCPRGWSLKKPASKGGLVAVNVEFKGTLATVWTATGVTATVSGAGNDKASGFSSITATGSSAPQAQTAPIKGEGTLKGSMGNINFVLNSDSKGTAAESAAPSLVMVGGTATIKSGTGKYAGATGVLTFKGQFQVGATTAGTKENQSYTASFTGKIKLK